MSKITDWLVDKFGSDKLLHFLVGAWAAALFAPLGTEWLIAVYIIMIVLSFVKETVLDTFFDIDDIIACCFGLTVSTVFFLLFVS